MKNFNLFLRYFSDPSYEVQLISLEEPTAELLYFFDEDTIHRITESGEGVTERISTRTSNPESHSNVSFLTRGYAKRRNGFLLGLRYANASLAHSGVESS